MEVGKLRPNKLKGPVQGHMADRHPLPCHDVPIFFSGPEACGILVPPLGIEPMPPAVEVESPNRWTTREVPMPCLFSSRSPFWGFCVTEPWSV